MKKVLISIHPRWCAEIFNGQKTIEVRKTRPLIDMPFKVFVYETKAQFVKSIRGACTTFGYGRGKVIGEFICDRVICCQAYYGNSGEKHLTNLFGIEVKQTCLTEEELFNYIVGNKKEGTGWLWHISDIKIYDKPRELGEFSKYGYKYLGGCCVNNNCKNYVYNGYYQPPECKIDGCFLKRPPQSWCYVEELQ